jgi:hypothetical protein
MQAVRSIETQPNDTPATSAKRAPLEVAPLPDLGASSSAAPETNDAWTRMPTADRLAVTSRAVKSKMVADKLARTAWADIVPKTRERIMAAMAPAAVEAAPEPVAPVAAPQAVAPAETAPAREAEPTKPPPELVKTKTIDGINTFVQKADLDGDKPLIRMFTKDGQHNGRIHRDNLDPTGEKQAAINKDNEDNPLFDVITNRSGGTFATKTAAIREISIRAIGETHKAVPAESIQPGLKGFLVVKKTAPAVEHVPEPQPAAPKKSPKQRAEEAIQARTDYFTPGNIVQGYSGHDRVISYKAPDDKGEGWNVTVQSVVKQDGKWVVDPKDNRVRTHSTHPDARELAKGPVERVKVSDQKLEHVP